VDKEKAKNQKRSPYEYLPPLNVLAKSTEPIRAEAISSIVFGIVAHLSLAVDCLRIVGSWPGSYLTSYGI
jgi:hypothetical protein